MRIIALVLIFVFGIQSTGLALQFHYCGSRIASVSIISQSTCGPEDMDCLGEDLESKSLSAVSCCSNKTVSLETGNQYTPYSFIYDWAIQPELPALHAFFQCNVEEPCTKWNALRGPPVPKVKRCILYQQLLLDYPWS